MGWFAWNKKNRSSDSSTDKKKQAGAPRVPKMESLEDRTVMTANLGIATNVEDYLTARAASGERLDTSLSSLSQRFESLPANSNFRIQDIPGSEYRSYTRDGRVSITALASGDVAQMQAQLAGVGMQGMEIRGNRATGWVSVARLDELADLTAIRHAQWNYKPYTNQGLVTSQADTAMRALQARQTFGVTGAGVKVGVISDSYNSFIFDGAPTDVFTGDLPNGVTVLSDTVGTDEGRAMLQLIHDLAPDAQLFFHTVGQSQDNFATAIDNLVAAGCDIIVDDVIFLAEPMFQDGVVAQAVDRAVQNGVVYFSSAGNNAAQSWEDTFRSSGLFIEDFVGSDDAELSFVLGRGELHDFNPGPDVDVFQSVVGVSLVVFQWDDSSLSATDGKRGPSTDYDIFVIDADGAVILDPDIGTFGIDQNAITGEPVEVFVVPPEAVAIFIVNRTGTFNNLKYVWYDTLFPMDYGGNTVGKSTVYGHANAEGAIAVAAAFYVDPVNSPENFTSLGGTKIYLDNDGNRIFPNVRNKPTVTGVDGTNNTFFGIDIEGDGFPNFFGTSAAAPHVAAVAALMLQQVPDASPRAIRLALEETSIDMGSLGFDFWTGTGLVQADAAIQFLTSMRSVIIVDVSQSMLSFNSLDIDGDGQLTDGDDMDGDGVKGTPLDQAIAVVRELDKESFFLPSVSIIVFGKDAKFVDLRETDGLQITREYEPGRTPNLLSFRLGSGGEYTTAPVDPSKSYYDRPMNVLLSSLAAGEFAEAVLITDGSGLLPTNNIIVDALATRNVQVNTFLVGHFHEVGSISAIQRLANATGGRISIDLTPVIVDNAILRPDAINQNLPFNNVAFNKFESVVRLGFGPIVAPLSALSTPRQTNAGNPARYSTTFVLPESEDEDEPTDPTVPADDIADGDDDTGETPVVDDLPTDGTPVVDEIPDATTLPGSESVDPTDDAEDEVELSV